jgi:serine/threonine protein kinase/GAF domain-containing protein
MDVQDVLGMTRKIGRFEVRRLLGKGAQSAVYLAYDPQLDREVAIKTLHFARSGGAQNRALLQEARTVAKLRHANIVPIYDAGEQDGDPYLVFEYVEGRTLAQQLRDDGPLLAGRAAEIMLGVLDGVGHAHRFGTIHRDLKPSNILLDADGLPRVMDFGIASQVSAPKAGGDELIGTPAYMSPEYIAHNTVSEQSDIFAAGLVLYEMLVGKRAYAGESAFQVIFQITERDVAFPEDVAERIDEKLRGIVAKATARDPARRYASTEQLHTALAEYLRPVRAAADGSDCDGNRSTLEFLLRRMRHKSDFPALSDAISSINRLAYSEKESVSALSNSILKDFALTNKILRVVNSAYYRTAGGGSISTVSRAVVTLGFDAIRNIAISLSLFEHLPDRKNASALKEELIRANLVGMLARGCCGKVGVRDGEEAFICALFHNLGRLLTQYYFAEEAEEIRRQQAQLDLSEDAAALRVLDITYEYLGIEMARIWGFPKPILRSMERLPSGPVRAPHSREDRLQVVAAFANDMVTAVERSAPGAHDAELARLKQRFGSAMPLTEQQLGEVLDDCSEELRKLAGVLRVNLKQTRIGRRVLEQRAPAPIDTGNLALTGQVLETMTEAIDRGVMTVPHGAEPDIDAIETGGTASQPLASVDSQAVLAAGIQDISNSLVDNFSLNDVLRIILETMYRAMGFKHVLLCLRDPRTHCMAARFGFGPDTEETIRRFRFPLGQESDIFNVILNKGVDVLIADAADPKIAQRIPDWYRESLAAQTFIIFPLMIKDRAVAMIYADRDHAGDIVITERELSLLRTLRNQAVLAIKQSA